MKLDKKILTTIIFLITLLGCNVGLNYQDQKEAAKVAENFANLALVKSDFAEASKYLISGHSPNEGVERLKQLVSTIHPSNMYPVNVKAEEYEIVPNSSFVRIYLQGAGKNNEKYFYCLVMILEADKSYKVAELYRSKNDLPFTESGLRRVSL